MQTLECASSLSSTNEVHRQYKVEIDSYMTFSFLGFFFLVLHI